MRSKRPTGCNESQEDQTAVQALLRSRYLWLATHIALEEAGAPYEAVRVDFGSQAQRSPEYLAVNPKGRVPALVTDRGTLTETPGLLLFVAQRFPQAELAPLSDSFALAQVQEFNSYLCSTVHVAHAHGRR